MNTRKKLNIALTIVSVMAIGVSGTLLIRYIRNKRKGKDSFDKTTEKNFWEKILYGVISREYGGDVPCPDNCSSKGCYGKRYTDVLCLDGGTIGIAHFASGGLKKLYEVMDTQKYFNRSKSEMIDNYASKTSGASENQWWLDGFRKWVSDSKNDKIQDELFKTSRQGAVDSAKDNGWNTDRDFAIAVGVSNSFGNSGFRSKAKMNGWDSEKTLEWYRSQSTHKKNRAIAIDKWFPKSKERKINI